jgi:hypothetical protein
MRPPGGPKAVAYRLAALGSGDQSAAFGPPRPSIAGLNRALAARNLRGVQRMVVTVKGNGGRRDGGAIDAHRSKAGEQGECESQ